ARHAVLSIHSQPGRRRGVGGTARRALCGAVCHVYVLEMACADRNEPFSARTASAWSGPPLLSFQFDGRRVAVRLGWFTLSENSPGMGCHFVPGARRAATARARAPACAGLPPAPATIEVQCCRACSSSLNRG